MADTPNWYAPGPAALVIQPTLFPPYTGYDPGGLINQGISAANQTAISNYNQQVSAVNYFSDLQSFGAKAIAEMQQVNANNLASMKRTADLMGVVAFQLAGLSTSDLNTLDQDVASASGSDSLAGSFVQTSGDASTLVDAAATAMNNSPIAQQINSYLNPFAAAPPPSSADQLMAYTTQIERYGNQGEVLFLYTRPDGSMVVTRSTSVGVIQSWSLNAKGQIQ